MITVNVGDCRCNYRQSRPTNDSRVKLTSVFANANERAARKISTRFRWYVKLSRIAHADSCSEAYVSLSWLEEEAWEVADIFSLKRGRVLSSLLIRNTHQREIQIPRVESLRNFRENPRKERVDPGNMDPAFPREFEHSATKRLPKWINDKRCLA